MTRLLLKWVVLALSVVAASLICQSLGLGFYVKALHASKTQAGDILELFIGVAILAILNSTLKPILKVLAFPLTCLTLGLFSFVINAAVLYIAAMVDIGFTIKGPLINSFLAALVGSILISCINAVLGIFVTDKKND
jgi:putative membrane protein